MFCVCAFVLMSMKMDVCKLEMSECMQVCACSCMSVCKRTCRDPPLILREDLCMCAYVLACLQVSGCVDDWVGDTGCALVFLGV